MDCSGLPKTACVEPQPFMLHQLNGAVCSAVSETMVHARSTQKVYVCRHNAGRNLWTFWFSAHVQDERHEMTDPQKGVSMGWDKSRKIWPSCPQLQGIIGTFWNKKRGLLKLNWIVRCSSRVAILNCTLFLFCGECFKTVVATKGTGRLGPRLDPSYLAASQV